MTPRAGRRRRRRLSVTLTALVLLLAAAFGVHRLVNPPITPGCAVAAGGVTLSLDTDQAAIADTIAAEAIRMRLPADAVTVALAAALQESGLHNLDYGDRDSVGVFQQRPSQGWGARASLLQPSYAAVAFYRRLVQVPGWQRMDPGVAAQAVQRSSTPDAYSSWDDQAQTMANVLTGGVPAGLACRFPAGPAHGSSTAVDGWAASELGAAPAGRGWAGATWLVAHADEIGVSRVSYAGRTWTARGGTWSAGGSAALVFTVAA